MVEEVSRDVERLQLVVRSIQSVITKIDDNKIELVKDRDNQPIKLGDIVNFWPKNAILQLSVLFTKYLVKIKSYV